MEFEKDSPVSDDERHLAETRKVTLTPIHADVTPEDTPGLEYMASERDTKTQQNITNDSEDTANQDQLKQPARQDLMEKTIMQPAPPRKQHIAIIITAIIVVILGVAAFWFIQASK